MWGLLFAVLIGLASSAPDITVEDVVMKKELSMDEAVKNKFFTDYELAGYEVDDAMNDVYAADAHNINLESARQIIAGGGTEVDGTLALADLDDIQAGRMADAAGKRFVELMKKGIDKNLVNKKRFDVAYRLAHASYLRSFIALSNKVNSAAAAVIMHLAGILRAHTALRKLRRSLRFATRIYRIRHRYYLYRRRKMIRKLTRVNNTIDLLKMGFAATCPGTKLELMQCIDGKPALLSVAGKMQSKARNYLLGAFNETDAKIDADLEEGEKELVEDDNEEDVNDAEVESIQQDAAESVEDSDEQALLVNIDESAFGSFDYSHEIGSDVMGDMDDASFLQLSQKTTGCPGGKMDCGFTKKVVEFIMNDLKQEQEALMKRIVDNDNTWNAYTRRYNTFSKNTRASIQSERTQRAHHIRQKRLHARSRRFNMRQRRNMMNQFDKVTNKYNRHVAQLIGNICSLKLFRDTAVAKLGMPLIGDCVMSRWFMKNACTRLCGGGTKKYMRKVLTNMTNGGIPCSDFKERTTTCNLSPCKQDCEMKPWGAWGRCRPIGNTNSGFTKRSRGIQKFRAFGGKGCGLRRQSQRCTFPMRRLRCTIRSGEYLMKEVDSNSSNVTLWTKKSLAGDLEMSRDLRYVHVDKSSKGRVGCKAFGKKNATVNPYASTAKQSGFKDWTKIPTDCQIAKSKLCQYRSSQERMMAPVKGIASVKVHPPQAFVDFANPPAHAWVRQTCKLSADDNRFVVAWTFPGPNATVDSVRVLCSKPSKFKKYTSEWTNFAKSEQQRFSVCPMRRNMVGFVTGFEYQVKNAKQPFMFAAKHINCGYMYYNRR